MMINLPVVRIREPPGPGSITYARNMPPVPRLPRQPPHKRTSHIFPNSCVMSKRLNEVSIIERYVVRSKVRRILAAEAFCACRWILWLPNVWSQVKMQLTKLDNDPGSRISKKPLTCRFSRKIDHYSTKLQVPDHSHGNKRREILDYPVQPDAGDSLAILVSRDRPDSISSSRPKNGLTQIFGFVKLKTHIPL